jgi:Zn-dependent M28 family amino/carboxypeptidase
VLFSAHYDSVSTAPGVTDNGIGVATLMAMVQYFLEVEQPQKTVVFNFNNGEEDGLYGAHA